MSQDLQNCQPSVWPGLLTSELDELIVSVRQDPQAMPAPNFDRPFLAWDSQAIFAAAGSPLKLLQLLRDNDFPLPTHETISMWRTRGRIPHAWMPMCVYAVLRAERAKLATLFRTLEARPYHAEKED